MLNTQQHGIWGGRGEITAEERSLVWWPSPDVAYHAPRGFQLPLKEWRTSQTRLITPAAGFYSCTSGGSVGPSAFHYDAPCGGLAVMIADGLPLEHRQMYDTAFLHQQRLRSSKTWLKRQFNGPLDFKISQPMRLATGARTAVPGFYEGRELSVGEMMRLGREEARQQGVSDPTREEVVSYAHFALAKHDPVPFDEQAHITIPFIVRSAMLDSDLASRGVTDEERQMVTDRYANLVEPHLDDELAEFSNYLYGPKNSIVRQIANQRRAPGGELNPKRVAAALADLGWRSLLLSAKCVEVQMRCVAADLPEPLLGDDLRRFELLYYCRPHFGGLSLCMLAERFGFVREGLFYLMEAPSDPERTGVLLRLLQYYSIAVSQRRDLDRQRKRLRADAGRRRTTSSGKRRIGRVTPEKGKMTTEL